MGYLATAAFVFLLTCAILTLYKLAPRRIQNAINGLLEQIGGE
jgi:uncharacterized BrkB/YihY/UPF0761 family membrane protein